MDDFFTMSQAITDADTAIAIATQNWDYPNPFAIAVTVQPADIDSYNHVNNSVYIRWLDECARQHSKEVGIDSEQATELGYGMAVKDSYVSYVRAAYLGETLLVANWMTLCDGRLRATREFQIVRVSDGALITRAKLDYVCINLTSGKPSRMPPIFVDNYRPLSTS
ncbi:MAG: acyl-CoA thioester hydrolase [Paraglaciecola psychrophila]|jgi:acyl-CoA thioester hydrolase